MVVPVAVKLATVGLLLEQNVCGVVPVGADGVGVILTNTPVLVALSGHGASC